jgi:hypothetical protein
MIEQKFINDLPMNEFSDNLDKLDIKLVFEMIDPDVKDGVSHEFIDISSNDQGKVKILLRMNQYPINNIPQTRNEPLHMLLIDKLLPKILLMNPNQIPHNAHNNLLQLIITSIKVQILIFIQLSLIPNIVLELGVLAVL